MVSTEPVPALTNVFLRHRLTLILSFSLPTGKIDTLKHVKKDVMEMGKGTECGIGLEGFEEFKVDDQIQTYEEVKERRTL